MKGKLNIKTIIVMLIVVLVIVLGVLGIKTARTFMSGAAAGNEPKSVVAISSEDGKTATVTWTTEKETMGTVQYGPNIATLLLTAEETAQSTSHSVVLTNLGPGKNYYYRIIIGSDPPYENNGVPFSFKTKGAVPTPTTTEISPVLPTSNPSSPSGTVLAPTITVPGGTTCNKTTDYNKDKVVNSLDYLTCMKNGGSSATTTLTPTTSGTKNTSCDKIDYDKNGVINSLDRLKCLQNKAP